MNTKVLITIIGFVSMVIASNVYSLEPVVGKGEKRKNHESPNEVLLVESTNDGSEVNSLSDFNVESLDKVKWERKPRIAITRADLEGQYRKLLLNVKANNQGIITSVTVILSSGLIELDKKAISAVKNAKIKPYQLNGQYYSFDVILPFEFYIE
ncbi:TonB family protein [Acinetobacter oleivorans]|uniref:energy transducer TonB n=1 Tax=Acinetobacter oleivorans TaxID=1148157 RepID=UPI0015801548|nr:energy transducer TonB [Acinetobacter oleivorans]NUF23614.1 TonB family protein [Acinetobacter oleivorans]